MLAYIDIFRDFTLKNVIVDIFFWPRNLGPRVIVESNNGISMRNSLYRPLSKTILSKQNASTFSETTMSDAEKWRRDVSKNPFAVRMLKNQGVNLRPTYIACYCMLTGTAAVLIWNVITINITIQQIGQIKLMNRLMEFHSNVVQCI